MTLVELLERLQTARRSSASGYVAECPAHDDQASSLSITEKQEKALVKCRSGCNLQEIAHALGLKERDFFVNEKAEQSKGKPDFHRVAQEILANKHASWYLNDGKLFCCLQVNEVQKVLDVPSSEFSGFLGTEIRRETDSGILDRRLREIIETLVSHARYEDSTKKERIYLRVAPIKNGLAIDLGDEAWRCVTVNAAGREIVSHLKAGVLFRRTPNMLPLPYPSHMSQLPLLRRYINLRDDEAFALVAGWMVQALQPAGPYANLQITGQQGTAKSTTARIIRGITDPNSVSFSRLSKDERDTMTTARPKRLIVFDNLSYLTQDQSDLLCTINTGGGREARALYSDADLAAFSVCAPTLMTAIAPVVKASDLMDRTVTVELEPILEDKRQCEADIMEGFKKDAPAIFAGLLDALILAEQNREQVKMSRAYSPRMIEMAVNAMAAEAAFGVPSGTWEKAHRRCVGDADADLLEDPLAISVIELASEPEGWEGTATDLFLAVRQRTSTSDSGSTPPSQRYQPKTITKSLRSLEPALARRGVTVSRSRTGHERMRMIKLTQNARNESSANSLSASSALSVPDFTQVGKQTQFTSTLPEETQYDPMESSLADNIADDRDSELPASESGMKWAENATIHDSMECDATQYDQMNTSYGNDEVESDEAGTTRPTRTTTFESLPTIEEDVTKDSRIVSPRPTTSALRFDEPL